MSVSFDKRLAELDAYLQMLISENEALDKKLIDYTRSFTSTINSSDQEIENIVNIKNNLEKLLSSIKHAIVLLQIARVSSRADSISSSYSGGGGASIAGKRSSSSTNTTPSPPTRPTRSPKLKSGTSRLATSSCKSSSAAAPCAESSNESGAIAGCSQINDNNLHTKQESQVQQQEQQLASQAVTAAAVAASAEPLQLGDHFFSPHSSQLHDTAPPRGSHQATSSKCATTAKELLASSTSNKNNSKNNNDNNVAQNLRDGIEDEEDDDADFFDAADEQQQQQNLSKSSTNSQPSKLFDDTSHPPNSQLTTLISTTIGTDIIGSSDTIVDAHTYPERRETQRVISTIMSETNNNVDSTVGGDGSIDWDAMYDEEEDEELGSMEGQGSMIKHLLSQIRIGMDLTKVVLPTFILERRSLLEMYADFFAHPDLFSAIPDFSSPEERMIQLVRWYLSAFHAGRKSSLAKKPYNPILGEIFKCQWKLPGDKKANIGSADSHKTQRDNNGHQPEQEQNLTFVAEQVSHHPPVSAFYAVNEEKSISCCAHIYTKSKYLGLSVGVHNIGHAVLNLANHNETYLCTFPSAYGRSILTIPWVELGGPVTITCEQTGYKANIEFLMKPFYGGKKHRITGEILRPNNEPILTVDGEWNGVMYSKSPPNSSDKKIFVDTTNLPVIKKCVKPVTTQESFESRNVWKEVTRALKMKDVNGATAAKSYIEQRQRDLLKDRQEQGAKWKTRYFEASGDAWIYSSDSNRPTDSD